MRLGIINENITNPMLMIVNHIMSIVVLYVVVMNEEHMAFSVCLYLSFRKRQLVLSN